MPDTGIIGRRGNPRGKSELNPFNVIGYPELSSCADATLTGRCASMGTGDGLHISPPGGVLDW